MIPKFKYYFFPFLKNLESKETCRLYDLSKYIGKDLGLADTDMSATTKGGRQTKHSSRVNYCASYLKKMGLVEAYSIGSYRITQRGKDVLKQYGTNLTLESLRELPEFIATQINADNKDVVYVKSHKRGDKIIGPYVCNKKFLKIKNPNIVTSISENYRESLSEKKKQGNQLILLDKTTHLSDEPE